MTSGTLVFERRYTTASFLYRDPWVETARLQSQGSLREQETAAEACDAFC
jgi:hypothetical protein